MPVFIQDEDTKSWVDILSTDSVGGDEDPRFKLDKETGTLEVLAEYRERFNLDQLAKRLERINYLNGVTVVFTDVPNYDNLCFNGVKHIKYFG